MFLVCDPIAWDLEHVPFNAALIKTIRLAFPKESIYFYGEEFHLRELKKQIGTTVVDSIHWTKIALPARHSSFFYRFKSDYTRVKFLLNKLNRNSKDNVLVITYANSSLLWALKYLVNTKCTDKKIQIIFHGGLSDLCTRASYRQTLRLSIDLLYIISSLKTALKLVGYKKIQHIVLEEAVRDAVLKELPFLEQNLFVFDHPVPTDKEPVENSNFNPPIRFGFLGRATKEKGFLKYLSVAADISNRFPGMVKFHLIGRLINNRYADVPEIRCLDDKVQSERLSREQYIKRLKKIHYVCLFNDKDYEFIASGVLLDSIAFAKPIIASKLPIFENLKNKFGDIGYFCDSNEFSRIIINILEKYDLSRYRNQVQNMLKIRDSRTPEMLAIKYLELVEGVHT